MKKRYEPIFAHPFVPSYALNHSGQHLLFADNNEDEVVHVQRRRPTAPTAPQDRETAATPQRRRNDGGLPPTGGFGGGGGGGGGGLPGGGQLPGGITGIIIIVVIILISVFGGSNLLNNGSSDTQNDNSNQAVVTEVAPDATTVAASQATIAPTEPVANQPAATTNAGSAPGQRWTVMLYEDADDKVLEKDMYVDLNDAERAGSTARVNIVAQVDRFKGGFQGDGNWTSTKRFYVTKDDDLQTVHSQQLADLGEVNMADTKTLVDFVTWSMQKYPADKYVLILSDHGMGWPGGWTDASSKGASSSDSKAPLADVIGNAIYLNDLDKALGDIRSQTGLDKFEVIGMDACLMAQLEVFSALEPHARYAVASQETEPALGWAYTSFLGALVANPDMNGATLSKSIVQSYINDDQRIVDDTARAELAGRGSTLGGIFDILGAATASEPSAKEVASEMEQDVTLTAFDLGATAALNKAVNNLSSALQGADQKVVAKARSAAQSYTSIFGDEVPASYIDLENFTQLLQKLGTTGAVGQAITQVQTAIKQGVIAEKHGSNKPGSFGVAIYFPVSKLYRSPEAGPASYTAMANRFATESLWDDFLAFHYTGRNFEANAKNAVVPDRATTVRGPGASQIEAGAITASGTIAAPGKPVTLRTRITGENVGYVYVFTGFYDKTANSIFVADTDYLESSNTQQVSGVSYPVWPQQAGFTLEFDWEPLMFAISDGTTSETALFTPQAYGLTREEATYTVDGTYTYKDGGDTQSARLYFRNGVLRQVFGFTNADENGAPREITPQAGDTFTIQEQWMDLDQNGKVEQTTTQTGGVLTFGEQPFTWKEQNAAPGDYIVGFIVKDLDGNATETYTQITVQ
ncbi:hypothetical protein BH10CHL1_BH10CHL1_24760 [soil metagenome]